MVESAAARPGPEHLTPHDLVTYSRCPHEMELGHLRRLLARGETPPVASPKSPERHSPLLPPPLAHVQVFEGRIDLQPSDTLVYLDAQEHGLPVLFPPERVLPDPRFLTHGVNLIDDELMISGRPDFVVRSADGAYVPIEYKATHLFGSFLGWHGRTFDVIQAIAECRLVEAVTGQRPPRGIVLYGDAAQRGDHEGWLEVGYLEPEIHWLRYALALVRGDSARPPVPQERFCGHCEANREGLCRYAAVASVSTGAPDLARAFPTPRVSSAFGAVK